MTQLQETIEIFEALRKHKYIITVENGDRFSLKFIPENYHHLVGYQHLTDSPKISKPFRKSEFYRNLKNGKITDSEVTCSSQYKFISERIDHFKDIPDILSAGKGKIIVEFDNSIPNSEIVAKYYLYKRVGNPLIGEQTTYSMLFIGYSKLEKSYYPATFIIEHSPRYIRDQDLLNCTIEVI